MILHVSLGADRPRHVAETLALLIGGRAYPLAELGEGAWMAVAGDDRGTLVEVLPRGAEFHHAPGEHVELRLAHAAPNTAFHLLLESPHDEARVLAIAREQGCSAHRIRHGYFEVIEFWMEGAILIEVATPDLAHIYKSLLTIENVEAVRAGRPVPALMPA